MDVTLAWYYIKRYVKVRIPIPKPIGMNRDSDPSVHNGFDYYEITAADIDRMKQDQFEQFIESRMGGRKIYGTDKD